jgi:hypothetical protein
MRVGMDKRWRYRFERLAKGVKEIVKREFEPRR